MTDLPFRLMHSQRPDESRYTNLMGVKNIDNDLPIDQKNLTVVTESFLRDQDRLTKGVSKMSKASAHNRQTLMPVTIPNSARTYQHF